MPIRIEEQHGFRFPVILCDSCLELIERDKDGVVAFVRVRKDEGDGASIFTACDRQKCAKWRRNAVKGAATLMPIAAFIVYLATADGLDRKNAETLTRKLEAAK